MLSCAVVGCGGPAPTSSNPSAPTAAPASASSEPVGSEAHPSAKDGELVLVESWPSETDLDHAGIEDASDVWPRLIDSATTTIDVAHFYASEGEGRTRLTPSIEALGRAVERGVQVRILLSTVFRDRYPELPRQFQEQGADVRFTDFKSLLDGVHHAKYMVIDGRVGFLGSQNFDYRALEHIQELGVATQSKAVVEPLQRVFEYDWELFAKPVAADADKASFPIEEAPVPGESVDSLALTELVASPQSLLPVGIRWDLPVLVGMIDGAHDKLRLQLLSYSDRSYGDWAFSSIDDALVRAGARGVEVEVLLGDWVLSEKKLPPVIALDRAPGIEVRVLRIPVASQGEIPFARVAHAKYMVTDRRVGWLGTSNFSGDYFYRSRNVGVVSREAAFAAQLDDFFESGWTSSLAVRVTDAVCADDPGHEACEEAAEAP